jgi:hydrogenase nickel incorporation protein HypA/HybF
MHELSIAQALVEQVEEVRSANEGLGVVSVGLRIGTWRLVAAESLQFYYRALTRDTALNGSVLEIEVVQARGRCVQCAEVFPVEAPLILCPACGSVGGDLVSGQELDLVSVELMD